MRFEHFAINVPDPIAMADWCVANLGMKIVRTVEGPPHTRFLADATGRTVMEIYINPISPIPDYPAQHPLNFHYAVAVPDPEALQATLIAAGATYFETVRPADGSILVMLRDPWGVGLQLCRRAQPMP